MFKTLLPALLVAISPVWATISYYQGPGAETNFETDRLARGLTFGSIVDFTGQSLGATLTNVGGTDVNFSVATGFIDVNGGAATYSAPNSGDSLRIDLPANVYSIGFYLSKPTFVGSTLTYAGGSFGLPSGSSAFFGVMSDLPLASISPILLSPSQGMTIHSFYIGTEESGETELPTDPNAVPEPSTMALLGGSLAGLMFMAQRKKRLAVQRLTPAL